MSQFKASRVESRLKLDKLWVRIKGIAYIPY